MVFRQKSHVETNQEIREGPAKGTTIPGSRAQEIRVLTCYPLGTFLLVPNDLSFRRITSCLDVYNHQEIHILKILASDGKDIRLLVDLKKNLKCQIKELIPKWETSNEKPKKEVDPKPSSIQQTSTSLWDEAYYKKLENAQKKMESRLRNSYVEHSRKIWK